MPGKHIVEVSEPAPFFLYRSNLHIVVWGVCLSAILHTLLLLWWREKGDFPKLIPCSTKFSDWHQDPNGFHALIWITCRRKSWTKLTSECAGAKCLPIPRFKSINTESIFVKKNIWKLNREVISAFKKQDPVHGFNALQKYQRSFHPPPVIFFSP